MISDTVSDVESISRLLERPGSDGMNCRPAVVVTNLFLSEIPLSFVPSLNLGQVYHTSQLGDALFPTK
jgi:hypothetical protein